MLVPIASEDTLERALGRVHDPFLVVERPGGYELAAWDSAALATDRVAGYVPRLPARSTWAIARSAPSTGSGTPTSRGRWPTGSARCEIVEAMGRAGMLGIFGAAGLPPPAVEAAIDRLGRTLGHVGALRLQPDPQPERARPRGGGRRPLSPARRPAGRGVGVPRPDAAGGPLPGAGDPPRRLGPGRGAEPDHRQGLAGRGGRRSSWRRRRRSSSASWSAAGEITPEQAEWAGRIPMAEDVTAEADSGGHTDNRPAIVLLPTMLALRDRLQAQYGYDRPLAGRRGGGHLDPVVGGGGVRDGGGLRRDRLGQPGVRRVGHVRRRPADARRRRSRPTWRWRPPPTCSRWA